MKFQELGLQGAWLIDATPFGDDRGVFRRHFCADEFAEHGLASVVRQANVSENPISGTLRGFHYQEGEHAEAKTMSCITGAIYDIIVDLRPDSTTFMRWVSAEISSSNRRSIHIPVGCANAFLTTAPNTVVHYYVSQRYHPSAERGIRYDDPAFGFQWPAAPNAISDKDRNHPDFEPPARS